MNSLFNKDERISLWSFNYNGIPRLHSLMPKKEQYTDRPPYISLSSLPISSALNRQSPKGVKKYRSSIYITRDQWNKYVIWRPTAKFHHAIHVTLIPLFKNEWDPKEENCCSRSFPYFLHFLWKCLRVKKVSCESLCWMLQLNYWTETDRSCKDTPPRGKGLSILTKSNFKTDQSRSFLFLQNIHKGTKKVRRKISSSTYFW